MSQEPILSKEQVEELVVLAQRGNSDAFAKIYDVLIDRIYRYIYYRVGKDEAEDLTEVVFLKTWEHIRQYRPARHSFSAWVFRIAHNVIVDHYRSHHSIEELSEQVPDIRRDSDTVHLAQRQLTNEHLLEAMNELSQQYRQILVLKYINDLSNEEIGYIMGKSQAAVRILQFRALHKLRFLLEERGISSSDA